VIANLNGDAYADVVILDTHLSPPAPATQMFGRTFPLLGRADGTLAFDSSLGSPRASGAWTLAGTGDFTGDGREDVLILGKAAQAPAPAPAGVPALVALVLSYPGASAAEMAQQTVLDYGSSSASDISSIVPRGIGDVDGDGKLDFAATETVMGSGPPGTYVTKTRWWRGAGDGTFGTATDLVGAFIVDADGDGKVDQLLPYSGSTTRVFWNTGGGVFSEGGAIMLQDVRAVADFNGDGKPDVLGPVLAGGGDVLPGDGHRAFGASLAHLPGSLVPSAQPTTNSYVTKDVNGDGAADYVVSVSGVTSVYLSTAKGARPANPDVQCAPLAASSCASSAAQPASF
jgi:hypothetical protein